jgi:hypothetical protein
MRSAGLYLSALLVVITGCSKKEKGVEPGEGLSIEVRLMGYDAVADTTLSFELGDMRTENFDGEKGVPLVEFVPLELIPMYDKKTPDDPLDDIDRRPLYAYRIKGADGYNVHDNKGYDDQRWSELQNGYIGQESRRAEFDESLGLAGAYRVTDVAVIEVYRKVEIVMADGSALAELADFPAITFQGERSVALVELLREVSSPESYSYKIVAVDGYTGISPFTWEQVQTGYWLLASDRTGFDPDLGGKSKIRYVRSIEVVAP